MITTPDTNRWLRRGTPNPNASLRCFCLPYVGGSARIFQPWSQSLPDSVEVCALELPGHGTRLTEQPFDNWDAVLEAISQVILPLCDRPFVFFGHSMGALISFELARYCRRHNLPMPSHLYVSGHRAPQLPDPEEPVHNLPEQAFREKLTRLQGTPPAVLNNKEFMAMLLPVLRADFTLCETYSYVQEPPLPCPITAFGGTQDPTTQRGRLRAWRAQTQAKFTRHVLPGKHFFIQTEKTSLLNHLKISLGRYA
ncbi:thioesterase II family protein [Adonisia turfae]|uniref:Thioesterase n=1 Tax=Adonisia turfae CCMR0081 TaxID=2292702 RepID=A0A6M0RUD4_9CYAN|nr:alpha/beta fold hydrolase [Adonisia turfae]NEZ59383.1 thioesterase [Adonisia turfae CCMR0081]